MDFTSGIKSPFCAYFSGYGKVPGKLSVSMTVRFRVLHKNPLTEETHKSTTYTDLLHNHPPSGIAGGMSEDSQNFLAGVPSSSRRLEVN